MTNYNKEEILAVLVRLMADKRPTDGQREYSRTLKDHWGIDKLPLTPLYLPGCSPETQRQLYRTIIEFLCMGDDEDRCIPLGFAEPDSDESLLQKAKVIRKRLRRNIKIRYYAAEQERVRGQDVLMVLQLEPQEKQEIAFAAIEFYHSLGPEGILVQYEGAKDDTTCLELSEETDNSEENVICTFEQWEKLQYDFLAQELLDSLYAPNYKAEDAYKQAVASLMEKLQQSFKDGSLNEDEMAGKLAEKGFYLDLLKKEASVRMEIRDLAITKFNWTEDMTDINSDLYKKTVELREILNLMETCRYERWLEIISSERLTEDQLWDRAVEIGLIPDAEYVLHVQKELL